MIYSGQGIFYVARERRRFWRSRPAPLLLFGSFLEIAVFSRLANRGTLMADTDRDFRRCHGACNRVKQRQIGRVPALPETLG